MLPWPRSRSSRRCRCGHVREAHSHYRSGGECAAPCECERWDRRFLALRACWAILRGDPVAWKLGVAPNGGFSAPAGGLFAAGCVQEEPGGEEARAA
jgi:hypothetical protein